MTKALKTREAAAYLGVHVETLRRLARRREIPSFKVGRDWRFNESELDRWARNYGSRVKTPHILVADDDFHIVKFLENILHSEGYRVSAALDGFKALELFHSDPPDLAMVDLWMPEMSGPELMRYLRKHRPGLPIIVITGYPDSDLMIKAMQCAPFTVIAKPAPIEVIIDTVAQAISGAAIITGPAPEMKTYHTTR